jgi:hypothetical protein
MGSLVTPTVDVIILVPPSSVVRPETMLWETIVHYGRVDEGAKGKISRRFTELVLA